MSQYTFSQSNSTYTAISGGTVLGTSTTTDDQRFLDPSVPLGGASFTGVGLPIGFNFNYNGYVYNRFGVNANGWISLGSSLLTPSVDMNTTSSYTPLSSVSTTVSSILVSRICGFTRDLMTQSGGEIRYQLIGASPNQVMVIQWTNYSKYLAVGDSFNFQIKLHETSNVVDIVYGTMTNNTTATLADCGLRSNPNSAATNFSSRTTATDWSATSASTAASDKVLLSNTIFPSSGLVYTWSPPPTCTGTPSPGNTISSTALACSGIGFDITLQNTTSGSGVTYQWQSSLDGSTYTNASGFSTDVYYTAIQTVPTYYKCLVTCSGSGVTTSSTAIMVGLNTLANCYCTPTYTSGKIDGDLLSNITISGTTLANNSGTDAVNPAYTFYSGLPNYTGVLQAGSSYNVNVSVGTVGSQNVAVWIDYNDDSIFSTSERVGYTTASIGANGTASFPIVLACNPPLGTHRMRVRDVWNTSGVNIDPCVNYGWGETEDYNIDISSPVACPQPTGVFLSSVTSTSAVIGWNSGCTETQWNVYVTNSGNPAPTTTATYYGVGNPFVITGLDPGTAYDFYVSADCLTNGSSLWTNAFSFTTKPVNDECTGATALLVGNNFASNAIISSSLGATFSNAPTPGCATYSGGDVWFNVTIPVSGKVTIETAGVANSPITNTVLAVYSGNCSALSLIACNNDTSSLFSSITLSGRTPGEIVKVLVWKFDGAVPYGQFKISAFDCESTTPAPTGDANQLFCSPALVADLFADGTSIKWYSSATSVIPLSDTDALVSGTYYASQTLTCESYNRLSVSVVISSFPNTVNSSLTACDNDLDGNTLFNLTAANSSLSPDSNMTFSYFLNVFDAEANENVILNPSSYLGANGQTVFARIQNISGCYNTAELSLIVTSTPSPTGVATQNFCGTSTLSNLSVSGTSIVWYDSATLGNILPATTQLVSGTTYYATQTLNQCESGVRLAITVNQNCLFVGCLNDPNGQWPGTIFTPNCIGIPLIITPIGYAGEYSKVNVTSGIEYTFASSIATDVITISDQNGTQIYSFGTGSVVWISTISGVIRFYTHVNATCADNQDERERTVQCGTPPPAPVNDNCASATMLTVGGVFSDNSVVGTNLGATDSSGLNDPTCSSYAGGDIWYSVVVPASGNITLETDSNGTSDVTDTGIEVFSGSCSALTSIGCNDDAGNGFFSLASLTALTAGSTIYLRVFDYDNLEYGTFQVAAYDASLNSASFDNSAFTFYPNPVKDVLNLSYSQNMTKVQVVNILGQEVLTKNINTNQSQIDMSILPSGTYLVKITSDSQIKTIKVIKQ